MYFYERVLVAVFPFDRLITLSGRLGQKAKACLFVAKYDQAVGLWVNTAFHNLTSVPDEGYIVKEWEVG